MKPKPARSKVRRPPKSDPASAATSWAGGSQEAPKAVGGPSTRGDSKLGRLLVDLLAYFEVRQVSLREIELIRPTHDNGWLRPQVEAKLARLHPDCPEHRELERLVRLSLEILSAADEGRFNPGPAWPEIEPWLLRALAYFISETDAIPDHLPEGFDDDMREFQSLAARASDLFGVFEALHSGRVQRPRPGGNPPA